MRHYLFGWMSNLYQGDDWVFDVTMQDPDADYTGCTLTYTLKTGTNAPITIASTGLTNNIFSFSVPAVTTATFPAGKYYVSASLVNALGQKTTLDTTEISIRANLAALGTTDPRSLYQQALDDIEACLAQGAGSDVQEYTIGGSTTRLDRKGLLELRAFFLQRVRLENGQDAIGSIYFYL